MVDVGRGKPGTGEGLVERGAGQGDERLFAEPVLPLSGAGLTGDPPTLEELVGDRGVTDHLGDTSIGGEDEPDRPVTAL